MIVVFLGNTKIIGQKALQRFKEELGTALKDPYQVVMKQTKLPITLLNESAKVLFLVCKKIYTCISINNSLVKSFKWDNLLVTRM